MSEFIKDRLLSSADLFKRLAFDNELIDSFYKTLDVIVLSLKAGNKILIAGNGGSAADSIHFTAEMVGRFKKERDPLPCIAIVSNISNLTCIANDYSFDEVFARQIRALGNKADVFIGISTSGNSENVIRACKVAKEIGITVIGLTGRDGGRMKDYVDINLLVKENETPMIQEAHITILHSLAEEIEKRLFKD
ncbi:MAG: SIS domain-containing protein [Candidatus Hydrogenedentota bacterium]